MKNIISILFLLFVSGAVYADEVTVVARIHSLKEARDTLRYPVVLEDSGLNSVLSNLDPKDEVILKGRIDYHPVSLDGKTQMNPTFHVEKIIPISLEKIGKMEFIPVEKMITFAAPAPYAPGSLPVTGKVASAITLTASILLLKELSQGQNARPLRDQIDTGLIFSAGALATGVYLWEQLKGAKKD